MKKLNIKNLIMSLVCLSSQILPNYLNVSAKNTENQNSSNSILQKISHYTIENPIYTAATALLGTYTVVGGIYLLLNNNNSMVPTVGLPNIGVSCWLNTTIQCLYNIPEFRNMILKFPVKNKIAIKTYALQIIFKSMQKNTVSSNIMRQVAPTLNYNEKIAGITAGPLFVDCCEEMQIGPDKITLEEIVLDLMLLGICNSDEENEKVLKIINKYNNVGSDNYYQLTKELIFYFLNHRKKYMFFSIDSSLPDDNIPFAPPAMSIIMHNGLINFKKIISELECFTNSSGDTYEVSSIIMHPPAHYYCYIKDSNGEWYECNDSTIKKLNISDKHIQDTIKSYCAGAIYRKI